MKERFVRAGQGEPERGPRWRDPRYQAYLLLRLGFTAGTNVVKEYWPTIFRSLRIAKIAPGLSPNATPAVARPPATLRFLP